MLVDTKVRVGQPTTELKNEELLDRMRLFMSGTKNTNEFNLGIEEACNYLDTKEGKKAMKKAEKGPFFTHDEVFTKLYRQFGLEYSDA